MSFRQYHIVYDPKNTTIHLDCDCQQVIELIYHRVNQIYEGVNLSDGHILTLKPLPKSSLQDAQSILQAEFSFQPTELITHCD